MADRLSFDTFFLIDFQRERTQGDGGPAQGFLRSNESARLCLSGVALCEFAEVRADRVVARDQCRTTVGSIVQATPLPTPPSECGGGLVCDPEIVGMTCRLLCPFGPPVEGTCQTTGIGCRCFGACL